MSLPSWLEPLPDAAVMREWDTWAIETRGMPSLTLMERAGEGLARCVRDRGPRDAKVAVVCGKGNNGGDGLVAARLLREAGRDVDVLLVWPEEYLSSDAKAMLARLPGPPPEIFAPERLNDAKVIVDAVLGTGFEGAPREPVDEVIVAINATRVPVIAADVPSGVNASNGEVEGEAVRAVATATFHRAKPGLWVHPGKGLAGYVDVVDIGIPRDAPSEAPAGLIGPGVLRALRRRDAASTKFTSGVVFVLGGSQGLTGAPTMAALAAMRSGAGYVTVGAPASTELSFTVRLLEAMVVGLPETAGSLSADAVEPALRAIKKADAVVLGPGLGKEEGAFAFVREIVGRIDVPLVVDADGLNALAGHLDALEHRPWPTILTPHAGELARLLETDSETVERHRFQSAREAAIKSGAVVVLKGDDTIVARPGLPISVSRGGAPGLATAGTGDVLAGVIATMLARGLPAAHAACAAVHVHLRAGQLAAAPAGADGVIASDVIAALPAALSE